MPVYSKGLIPVIPQAPVYLDHSTISTRASLSQGEPRSTRSASQAESAVRTRASSQGAASSTSSTHRSTGRRTWAEDCAELLLDGPAGSVFSYFFGLFSYFFCMFSGFFLVWFPYFFGMVSGFFWYGFRIFLVWFSGAAAQKARWLGNFFVANPANDPPSTGTPPHGPGTRLLLPRLTTAKPSTTQSRVGSHPAGSSGSLSGFIGQIQFCRGGEEEQKHNMKTKKLKSKM